MENERRDERPDRPERRGLIGSLLGVPTGIVRSVAKEVAPAAVDALDVNEVVERVDIQGVVDRVDVQGLVDRVDANALLSDLDVQALIDRVDLDTVLKQIDLDQLLARVDVNALIDRIDVDRVLDRVDLEKVLARIDVDALLARADLDRVLASIDVNAVIDRVDVGRVVDKVDVNAVIDRVDVGRVVDKVDVNAVAERVDVNALLQRTEMGSLMAHSTTSVLIKVLDFGRTQAAALDGFVHRGADRLLRREPGVLRGPPLLFVPAEPDSGSVMNVAAVPGAGRRSVPREHLLGTYAGAVSRLIGYAIDIGIVAGSFAIGASIVEWLVSTVFPVELDLGDTPIAAGIALGVWTFVYFTYSLATTGRTIGKALVGTRVVRTDGSDLHAGRAALRVLMMPLSFALFGIGLLLILIRKDRRALHDLIADTAEVYYWLR